MLSPDIGDSSPIIIAPSLGESLEGVVVKLPCPRTFGRNDTGDDVWSVQYALRKWGHDRRPAKEKDVRRYAPTGHFALPTVNQVKHFQDLHNVPQSGVVGDRTWRLLTEFMDGPAVVHANKAFKHFHPDTTRDLIVRAARDGYANRSRIHYVQVRPMVWHHFHVRHADQLYAEDCSSFATWCFFAAGAQDPNGFSYNGAGNTSSLRAHGKRTNFPRPGDLAHYADPDHVAIYIGNGMVISNGHYPMGLYPATYRHVIYYTNNLGD